MSIEKNAVANPELKAKLETLRIHESPELLEQIYQEIANEAHFLSVAKPTKDSTPEAPKYDFPVLTTAGHGYLFYPIFTDLDELRKWNKEEDVQVLVLSFDDYANMVEQDGKIHGLVVDPYGANFSIERDMVDYLKVQKAFFGKLAIEQLFHQQAGGGVKLEEPAPYPTEMVEAMKACMAANGAIRRAWLRLMTNEGEQSYLVVIDAEDGEASGDFGEISSAALPHLKDKFLDLMTLEDEFSQNAVAGVEPFYTK